MNTKDKNSIWRSCPVRLWLLAASGLWIGAYFLLRQNRAVMNTLCRVLVRPWHHFAGRLTNAFRGSLAQWCIAAALLALAGFLVWLCIALARHGTGRGRRVFCWAVTFLLVLSLIFGLFCLWWGVFYYSDSFVEQSGLQRRDVSVEELEKVTAYFAEIANGYAGQVARDENGIYTVDLEELFAASAGLYANVEEKFPCLEGPALRAKPVLFSRVMSRVNYTGFFFPYTAEANVNVDSPLCLVPSTVAHELAHQRGVAGEDEANFVAVLASLESGNADYIYSSALLAYIHLGNSLYSADYEAWSHVSTTLCDAVWDDLRANNAYWDQFEDTKASEVSEKVYESYLQIYGDDRGMQSYGACVDLLVCYYLPLCD